MKLAFPTNDRSSIEKWTGRCLEFALVELGQDGRDWTFIENDHHHQHDHELKEGVHRHGHRPIIDLMLQEGVDMLVVRHLGKHFREELDAAALPYIMVEDEHMASVILRYEEDIPAAM